MSQINTISLLAIRDMIDRIDVASKNKDRAKQIALLSQTLNIAPDQALFKVAVLQQVTAWHISDAAAELRNEALQMKKQVVRLEEEIRALEAARRPKALFWEYSEVIGGIAVGALIIGALIDALARALLGR